MVVNSILADQTIIEEVRSTSGNRKHIFVGPSTVNEENKENFEGNIISEFSLENSKRAVNYILEADSESNTTDNEESEDEYVPVIKIGCRVNVLPTKSNVANVTRKSKSGTTQIIENHEKTTYRGDRELVEFEETGQDDDGRNGETAEIQQTGDKLNKEAVTRVGEQVLRIKNVIIKGNLQKDLEKKERNTKIPKVKLLELQLNTRELAAEFGTGTHFYLCPSLCARILSHSVVCAFYLISAASSGVSNCRNLQVKPCKTCQNKG